LFREESYGILESSGDVEETGQERRRMRPDVVQACLPLCRGWKGVIPQSRGNLPLRLPYIAFVVRIQRQS
jgi:hypothetical protein